MTAVDDGLGARTWRSPDEEGPPASPRSQVAAAVVASAALLLFGMAIPAVLGWTIAMVLALIAAIAVGLAAPPLPLLARTSGLVLALIVGGVSMVLVMFAWAAAGVPVPPGVIPVLAVVALGLDWRRADRLRPVVTCAGAVVLLAALSKDPVVIGGAVVWLAAAFATYTLLEGDRRAALPRVQPDARAGAQEARPDDLLTTVLVAAAVALLAAVVLSVPSCQRRMDQRSGEVSSGQGSGSGSGSGQGSGSGSGSGGERTYVPDPDGRFLVPQGEGSGSAGEGTRIPSPEDVPSGLEPGSPRSEVAPDGTQLTYERRLDGDTDVTVRNPDGSVERWRLRERSDGLVQVDRLADDGTVAERYYYDPEGTIASGDGSSSGDPGAEPPPDPDRPDRADRPDGRAILQVLGALVLAALAIWLAVWWWRRHRPDPLAVDPQAPPWALALAARIDAEGRARGRPRKADESVVRYGRALGDDALPDPRLPVVAEVVSDALFSGADPGPTVQAWAETTFAEVVAAHPSPGRRERKAADDQPSMSTT